jgi:hypothetical protein
MSNLFCLCLIISQTPRNNDMHRYYGKALMDVLTYSSSEHRSCFAPAAASDTLVTTRAGYGSGGASRPPSSCKSPNFSSHGVLPRSSAVPISKCRPGPISKCSVGGYKRVVWCVALSLLSFVSLFQSVPFVCLYCSGANWSVSDSTTGKVSLTQNLRISEHTRPHLHV